MSFLKTTKDADGYRAIFNTLNSTKNGNQKACFTDNRPEAIAQKKQKM